MKNYSSMDAHKVSFNANEQVAAAGCTHVANNNKYASEAYLARVRANNPGHENEFGLDRVCNYDITDASAGVNSYF